MRPCQIVSVSNAYFVPGAFHSKNVCSCVLIPFPLIHVGSTVAFLQVLSLSVVVRGGADAFDQVSVVVCGGRCIRSGVCLWWSVVGQMHPIRCLAKCCTAICLLAGMPDSSEMLVPQAGQVRGTTKKARRQKQMCHGT